MKITINPNRYNLFIRGRHETDSAILKCSACKKETSDNVHIMELVSEEDHYNRTGKFKGWRYFKCCTTCFKLMKLGMPYFDSHLDICRHYIITKDVANAILLFFARKKFE